MQLPDALVRFVQAIVADEDLRLWFDSLEEVTPRERGVEFRSMADRIRGGGGHPELAHAIDFLAAPGMYHAVRDAVQELS